MKKAPPPPSSEAPVSREIVEIVKKKKLGPPPGPPPAGMSNFKAPKAYSPQKKSGAKDTGDDSSDEDSPFYQSKPSDRGAASAPVAGKTSRADENEMQAEPKTKAPAKSFPAKDEGVKLDNVKWSAGPNPPPSAGAGAPAPAKSGSKGMFNFHTVLQSTYRDLRSFVLSPLEPGYIARCYIERSRPMTQLFAANYSLCADMEDGTGRELIVCRQVLQSKSPHYVFSLKPEDLNRKREQRSRLYLGKLRGVSANEYVLYDNGICFTATDGSTPVDDLPEEQDAEELEAAAYIRSQYQGAAGTAGSGGHDSLYRKELAVLKYNTKKRPAPKGIRGLEVGIPAIQVSASSALVPSNGPSSSGAPSSLRTPFNRAVESGKQNSLHNKRVYIMHEKTSRYDPLSSCLVDFKGRANIPSVKNCQLIESETMEFTNLADQDKREFIFQMGKTTEDCFNMDFRYPLSLLQAFAIAVARFDAKVSWA